MTAEKVLENRLRRWAGRLGWRINKSRARHPHLDDHGLYMLANEQNLCVLGEKYDATLEEVEAALAEEDKAWAKKVPRWNR